MGFITKGWTKSKGIITNCQIKTFGMSRNNAIVVEYDYEVNGQMYSNKKISYSFTVGDQIDQLMFDHRKKKYALGQQVEVYYNSRKREQAVLEKGHFTSNFFGFGLGLAILIICLCI